MSGSLASAAPGSGHRGGRADGVDANALRRPTLGFAAGDGGERRANDAGNRGFAGVAWRRHGHDVQNEAFVERQLHAVGDDARDVQRQHQLLGDEILDLFDAGAALHVGGADGNEIDDDIEPAERLRGGFGEADRRFRIAAGVGEQLHLARRLGQHGGDGVQFGRSSGGVDDEAGTVIGEFASNVYAAGRRQARDKRAHAGKLTIIRRTRIATHHRHQHRLSLHHTPGG